jgi:hypothetical protein
MDKTVRLPRLISAMIWSMLDLVNERSLISNSGRFQAIDQIHPFLGGN